MLLGGLLFGFVDEELGLCEEAYPGAVGGAEIGQEDRVDLIGAEACALVQSCSDGCGRQTRINQNSPFARSNECACGMGGSDGLGFSPNSIAA